MAEQYRAQWNHFDEDVTRRVASAAADWIRGKYRQELPADGEPYTREFIAPGRGSDTKGTECFTMLDVTDVPPVAGDEDGDGDASIEGDADVNGGADGSGEGGTQVMEAHVKIAEGGGETIPRLYFAYDDDLGKVRVGFFGPHRLVPNPSAS